MINIQQEGINKKILTNTKKLEISLEIKFLNIYLSN